MAATKSKSAAPVRRRRRQQLPEVKALGLVAYLWGPLKVIGAMVIGLGAFVLAWHQLGFWTPASLGYVDGKVALVSHKVDAVDTETLQNRVETLTAAKSRDIGEQTDLQLKLSALKNDKKQDPDYIRQISTRLNFLGDQINSLTTQILAVQTAINKKNAEEADK